MISLLIRGLIELIYDRVTKERPLLSVLLAHKISETEFMKAAAEHKKPKKLDDAAGLCVAEHDSFSARFANRRGRLFTGRFPAIARACEKLPPGGRDERVPLDKPQLAARIEFTQVDAGWSLRRASFAGLREDSRAEFAKE